MDKNKCISISLSKNNENSFQNEDSLEKRGIVKLSIQITQKLLKLF